MAGAPAPRSRRTYRLAAGLAIAGALALLEALLPHLPKAEAADGEARDQLMQPMPPPPLSSATRVDPGPNPSQLLLPGQVITLQVVPYRQ
ncbi:MAG: hypothetical protein EBZ76_02280 [Synechococcaceae bacterium WB9_2_170]|nr:hypothetical protein [Synechococcaceae bacterium WB9_2_170]